jgi:hypothetical protein
MVDPQQQKPIGDFWFPKAAIETVSKFIKVLLKIAMTDAMIGSKNKAFKITDDDVHPW